MVEEDEAIDFLHVRLGLLEENQYHSVLHFLRVDLPYKRDFITTLVHATGVDHDFWHFAETASR